MKQNIGFRGWFYFRQGWTTYFAFIFAAINTMVVTYYLAIENIPFLKTVFPSFYVYLAFTAVFGIPLLVFVGYAHQKKTASYKAEADIYIESNPHALRMYNDIQLNLILNLKIIKTLISNSKNFEINQEELKELKNLEDELNEYFIQRKLSKNIEIDYFKKFANLK